MNYSNRLPIASAVLAAALGCQGCANFVSIDMRNPARVSEQLHAGNRIRVHDASGKPHTLEVEDIQSDQIVARDRSGAELHIEYNDTSKVERRDFAPGKTAALAASVVVALYGLLYGYAAGEAYTAALSGG